MSTSTGVGHYNTLTFVIVITIIRLCLIVLIISLTFVVVIMGRKPTVLNHPKALGGTSTNKHSVERRDRDEKLDQWLYDIQQAMQRERGRRFYYKGLQENGSISEEKAAIKYLDSRLTLVNEVREVLDSVPLARRNYTWIEKDMWEKEERRSVSI